MIDSWSKTDSKKNSYPEVPFYIVPRKYEIKNQYEMENRKKVILYFEDWVTPKKNIFFKFVSFLSKLLFSGNDILTKN
jgi:hypothetical protein